MEVSFTPLPNVNNWYVNIVPIVEGIDIQSEEQPDLRPEALIPGADYNFTITAYLEPSLATISDGDLFQVGFSEKFNLISIR